MRFVSGFARFEVRRSARVALALLLCLPALLWAQTTGSITGTVHDSSGAVIANAQVTVSNTDKGISRTTPSNSAGEYLVAGLGQGSYDITVTAEGFKKFEAKGVALDVAQKARVDVNMQVGAIGTEIVVEGTAVAQVETQSSDLTGVVSGKEISQLQLNGRNFTQLVTLVPGVSSQTGQDEGTVGVYGNVSYSVNGGRTEYNNWELDGGDNMDNGSNTTLNVYPSLDAIGEFKVLTSNYGAQYGRSGSGTVEVETKSGTSHFHGDVYEFNRNTAYNARNYFADTRSSYKKNDYGYTIGGPVFIPGVYNKDKQKTFFFWSEEWRKDKVPGNNFNVPVPTVAERGGDFSDVCPGSNCPHDPVTGNPFAGNIVPTSASDQSAVTGLLALIPAPNDSTGKVYNAAPILPTNWREELVRVDHNLTPNERLTFRYIHDSWDTISPTPLWTNAGSFPTIETNFKGPSVSSIARLTSTLSPTLLNEFQMSYTTDHIVLINVGAWQRGSAQFGDLFGGNGGGIIPGINFASTGAFNGLGEDPGYIPQGPYNSNPTYTYRDNVSKSVGKHNLQFGAYLVTAQKNELGGELGAGSVPGYLTFNTANPTSTGNAFADLLNGQIFSFGQQSQRLKYYNRYKILEPYFQDDFHVSSHLTLNLGLRISLFGTYRDKQHFAFNFDPNHYVKGQTSVNADGTVNFLTVDGLPASVTNLPNGIVQCGVTAGVPVGCMKGHLFNAAPRFGFAWDPKGDGKWAVRGGYGVFYEHTNGNEGNTESLENSPPLATTIQQFGIQGYQNIGTGLTPGATLPLSVNSVPTEVKWPYVQQWHFDLQHEIIRNTVATISYVGSKGTHLTRVRDLNQVVPPAFTAQNPNPYQPGQPIAQATATYLGDCATGTAGQGGPAITGYNPDGVPTDQTLGTPGVNMFIACGNGPDFFRPIPGYGDINSIEDAASSTYHGMEFGVRRAVGGLELNFAYTYSHSIDNSSSKGDNDLVNAYAPNANRASSTFDERHNLNFSYVWDLPFFKQPGLTHTLLGGWQYSGIMDFSTGSPFTVTFGSDNAGVANGTSNSASAYADIVGNPKAGVTPSGSRNIQLFNPSAYAAPRGLTFGDSGRNSLRNPRRTNFDMSLFKRFAIKERLAFEFRAEAFNVFNHTQLGYINGDGGSGANNSATLNSQTAGWASVSDIQAGNSNFLQVTQAHNPRILQLGAKLIF
jgi:hypothetical protein